MKYLYLLIFLFLFSCADINSAKKVEFLYDNLSECYEITDIGVYLDDSLVFIDTLAPDKVLNNWRAKVVEVKNGKQSIRVVSKINGLELMQDVVINCDTSIFIEYHHPAADTAKKYFALQQESMKD